MGPLWEEHILVGWVVVGTRHPSLILVPCCVTARWLVHHSPVLHYSVLVLRLLLHSPSLPPPPPRHYHQMRWNARADARAYLKTLNRSPLGDVSEYSMLVWAAVTATRGDKMSSAELNSLHAFDVGINVMSFLCVSVSLSAYIWFLCVLGGWFSKTDHFLKFCTHVLCNILLHCNMRISFYKFKTVFCHLCLVLPGLSPMHDHTAMSWLRWPVKQSLMHRTVWECL